MGFNPRPCARGDPPPHAFSISTAHVSIHAPVRGATGVTIFSDIDYTVSIHAPVRGATQMREVAIMILTVSIHAPVRGATTAVAIFAKLGKFQSTPLCEGRLP